MKTRTLGFLFTDLRGYTKFLEEHGDAAGSELVRAIAAVASAKGARPTRPRPS
jgi:class 3 adenylate cyclase